MPIFCKSRKVLADLLLRKEEIILDFVAANNSHSRKILRFGLGLSI